VNEETPFRPLVDINDMGFSLLKEARRSIFEDVDGECAEQEEKWGVNAKRAEQPASLWYIVLAEEVGEAARVICDAWNALNPEQLEALRDELVQIAAVAVSWIQALDSSALNCQHCCNFEENPEDRECPPECPVLLEHRGESR
jgi:NTP pyrophosphatase (non-canonical NTP hydrolase)